MRALLACKLASIAASEALVNSGSNGSTTAMGWPLVTSLKRSTRNSLNKPGAVVVKLAVIDSTWPTRLVGMIKYRQMNAAPATTHANMRNGSTLMRNSRQCCPGGVGIGGKG